jgi:tetratricopeptide (TPR) repeat protein
MCGRYRLSRRKQIVEEYFDCVSGEEDWTPRYNIAPTQPVPVIRQHHWYSVMLDNLGRTREALAMIEKAMALDPASPQINSNHADILNRLHRSEEALADLNKLIAANPEFPPNYGFRADAYRRIGNEDAYVADSVMSMKKNGHVARAEAFAAGYQRAKLNGAYAALIEVLKNESQKQYVSPNEIANYYALMGDRDHTFEWLEKGYAERSGRMEYIKVEDSLAPFHSDPRYINLLKRMGLPQ